MFFEVLLMKHHFSEFDYSTKQANLVNGNLSSHFAKELSDIRREPFKKNQSDLWLAKPQFSRSRAFSFVSKLFSRKNKSDVLPNGLDCIVSETASFTENFKDGLDSLRDSS